MKHDDVLALVVSFNGGLKALETIRRLQKVVSKVLVVDNGSNAESVALLDSLRSSHVELIQFKENKGVGCALNVGARYALKNKYEWVLTMDQDTLISFGLLDAYKAFIREHPKAALLAPLVCFAGRKQIKESENKESEKELDYAITSGNLVRAEMFKKIGFYNEELFIDGVDFDYCLRLRAAGEKIYLVPRAVIFHELGIPHQRKGWLGGFYSDHSPLRRYYIYRNYFYLLSHYWCAFPKFLLKTTASHFLMFVAIVLYERDVGRSLKYIAKGVFDGVRGKYGKYGG